MDFDFLSPPPLVETKKKYATFTVKEIGGPEEIIKWRQMQEAKESTYRLRLKARDERLEEVEASLGQKLEAPKIGKASWADKVAFAQSERVRLAKAEENVTQYPPWEPLKEPPKTISQRFVGFFKQLWRDANF